MRSPNVDRSRRRVPGWLVLLGFVATIAVLVWALLAVSRLYGLR